ncbi:MAG: hypothetical protein HZA54_12440 [Planctomycetes bacterium]|nr:hypothetical protein [Planctomycetota bacterium]
MLEVAVTGFLVTLLLAGLGPVWRDLNRGYVDARARTALIQELSLAVMSITQDMTRATGVTNTADELRIHLEGGGSVLYRVEESRLVREQTGADPTTVATSMESLTTATGTSFPVLVTLTASAFGRERAVELELGW